MVDLHAGVVHAEGMQQLVVRVPQETQIVSNHVAQRAHQQQRVVVGVFPARAWRDLQRRSGGGADDILPAEIDRIGIVSAAEQAARHPQQMLVGNGLARISRRGPLRNVGGPVEVEQPLPGRDRQKDCGHALGSRPGAIAGMDAEARTVLFRHDATALDDDHTRRHRAFLVGIALAAQGAFEDRAEHPMAGFEPVGPEVDLVTAGKRYPAHFRRRCVLNVRQARHVGRGPMRRQDRAAHAVAKSRNSHELSGNIAGRHQPPFLVDDRIGVPQARHFLQFDLANVLEGSTREKMRRAREQRPITSNDQRILEARDSGGLLIGRGPGESR